MPRRADNRKASNWLSMRLYPREASLLTYLSAELGITRSLTVRIALEELDKAIARAKDEDSDDVI